MKNKTLITLSYLALAAVISFTLKISVSAAPVTAEFLILNPSVRSNGSGGTSPVAQDDPSVTFLNPALNISPDNPSSSDGKNTRFTAAYTAWTQNTSYGSFAGNLPFNPRSRIGFGILYFGAGDIERRDASGALLSGNLSVTNIAFAISYANLIARNISVGSSLKIVSLDYGSSQGGTAAQGVMLDVGGGYYPTEKTLISLSALNIGTDINGQKAPLDFRLGLSHILSRPLKIAAEAEYPIHIGLKPKVGFEYSFNYEKNKTFSLRAGGEWLKGDSSLSFGAGFKTPVGQTGEDESLIKENTSLRPFNLIVDYSFTSFTSQDITPSHRISLGVEF